MHLQINVPRLIIVLSSTRNARQLPEESGPFGRNRSIRATGSRGSRTRTGTTPLRPHENPTILGFGKLLAKEQAKEAEHIKKSLDSVAGNVEDIPVLSQPDAIATECLLYGYASKETEWKVLSRFERIVAPSIICEDYPREDTNLFLSSSSIHGLTAAAVVHRALSKDALRKSSVYRGGDHWIKVTFDSYQAAEKACFYSPVEIDGHLVFCEMWQGKHPSSDQPILLSQEATARQWSTSLKLRSLTSSRSVNHLAGKDSAVSEFERAMQTLPRSHTMPDVQFGLPPSQDDIARSSTTASLTSATDVAHVDAGPLLSRSTSQLSTRASSNISPSESRIPGVKRVKLRPISEALPPQPTLAQRILRSIPVLNWIIGSRDASGDVIGEGPAMKEDGSWDENNTWYWSFWHSVDWWIGSDFCGLKDD